MGTKPYGADYRGGLLITKSVADEYHSEPVPYLYLRNSGGFFDHVAALGTSGDAILRAPGNLLNHSAAAYATGESS